MKKNGKRIQVLRVFCNIWGIKYFLCYAKRIGKQNFSTLKINSVFDFLYARVRYYISRFCWIYWWVKNIFTELKIFLRIRCSFLSVEVYYESWNVNCFQKIKRHLRKWQVSLCSVFNNGKSCHLVPKIPVKGSLTRILLARPFTYQSFIIISIKWWHCYQLNSCYCQLLKFLYLNCLTFIRWSVVCFEEIFSRLWFFSLFSLIYGNSSDCNYYF